MAWCPSGVERQGTARQGLALVRWRARGLGLLWERRVVERMVRLVRA